MSDKIKDLKAKQEILNKEHNKYLKFPRILLLIFGFTFLGFFTLLGVMEAPFFFIGSLLSLPIWMPSFFRMRRMKKLAKVLGKHISNLEAKEKEQAGKENKENKEKSKEEPKPQEQPKKQEEKKLENMSEMIDYKSLTKAENIVVDAVVNKKESSEEEMWM